MYHRLTELAPEWLSSGPGRHGQGVGFECPEQHSNCRVRVWFRNCLDEGQPVTMAPGLKLYRREGDTFERLEVEGTIQHGEAMLFIHDGLVACF